MSKDSGREVRLDPSGELFEGGACSDAPEERAGSRFELLYRLGRALCEETGYQEVVDAVLPALERMIGMERGLLASVDADGAIVPIRTHALDLSGEPDTWPLSGTILERVLGDGLALLTSDAQEDERLSAARSVSRLSIRSVLAVPLGPPRNPTGILYADNRLMTGLFSEEDLVFMTALAHFVSIALRNASELEHERVERERSEGRWGVLQQESMRRHRIVGSSAGLRAAYERLGNVSRKKVPLLLLGETGTGKELFARAVHALSDRAEGVFMPVNIAAFSETLVESELFGHERGAFSGATERKLGRIELAHGGTLFLDEVAEIPPRIQAKLLRTLETGELERVGGTQTLRVDVRLVSATNKELEDEIEDGRFREDLYYRIRGVTVEIPPLRDRRDDIHELVAHALGSIGSDKSFEPAALMALKRYAWPGNVRQLIRLVEEMDAVCTGPTVTVGDLPAHVTRGASEESDEFPRMSEVVAQVERQHMIDALELAGGNKERAIALLGISRAKFFDRMKAFEL